MPDTVINIVPMYRTFNLITAVIQSQHSCEVGFLINLTDVVKENSIKVKFRTYIHTYTHTHTGANEIYSALLFCTNMDAFSLNTDLIPIL